jgi:preprotein translocase subunit SecY
MFGGADYTGKALKMPLMETFRRAWADPDLKARIVFVLGVFTVYAFGVHVTIPIPGITPDAMEALVQKIPFFQIVNAFGGGALRRISIFALGLNPYITASIIIQILTTAFPQWKKELQEGGEYARRQQNRRTRLLTLGLCFLQGFGLLRLMASQAGGNVITVSTMVTVTIFWTAGAMFVLWLGEQISEKGIGNGVSLMIFIGIIISLPGQGASLYKGMDEGLQWYQIALLVLIFLATTWIIVLFTTAQRRIPIQHMRRMIGTKSLGGQTSYLPLSVNMAGVIPIIFAISLVYIPYQFANMLPKGAAQDFLNNVATYVNPGAPWPKGAIGCLIYTILIFFFTYFYTAIQYNVEDIANNLKRGGSFIPGVRPGKQTRDFLDGVISRITVAGAGFLSIVALVQYVGPAAVYSLGTFIPASSSIIGGTSLLIVVSVALDTMRQIEANILMKNYG